MKGHTGRRGDTPKTRGPIQRRPAARWRWVEAGRLAPRGHQRRRHHGDPPLNPNGEATAARASLVLTGGATGPRKGRRVGRRGRDLSATKVPAGRVWPLKIVKLG